jgi:hypothetical protein
MSYPIQIKRTYVNPNGNVVASGNYRSHLTQNIANDFPEWMHLRQNPRSIGQQLLASMATNLDGIERDLEYNVRSKFLNTAPIDEVDVLWRTTLPSSVNLMDATASGIRCIATLPGVAASGSNEVHLEEVTSLRDFYYNVLPNGMEILSSGVYVDTIDSKAWSSTPSGVKDAANKKYDVWKKRHDLTWCYSNGNIMKQDSETMESYETYAYDAGVDIIGMAYDSEMLWTIDKSGSSYGMSLLSTKTQDPVLPSLDLLARFDITGQFGGLEPSGILVDSENTIWVCDTGKTMVFELSPRYDYFSLDKTRRQVYFKEEYASPGVFISNT